MAINKALTNKKVPVMLDGVEAADVRGLLPKDIAEIIRLAGEKITDVLVAVDEFEFVRGGDPNAVADHIIAELPRAIQKISGSVPEFVALVIAYAADDPDAWEHVRDEWTIALQAEALATIAKATFVDDRGFRMFVGNVVALLQSGNALTSNGARTQTKTRRAPAR